MPQCQCCDSLCPTNHGHQCCCIATDRLMRIDMAISQSDRSVDLLMCSECSEDAQDSGVFTYLESV